MDILISDKVLDLLMIASTLSFILVTLIQKIKMISIIKTKTHVLIANFLCSFLGIPFGICFYNLDVIDGLWISLFSFIGAPTIYQILKSQNILAYKPKSLEECKDCIVVDKNNLIKREDEVK